MFTYETAQAGMEVLGSEGAIFSPNPTPHVPAYRVCEWTFTCSWEHANNKGRALSSTHTFLLAFLHDWASSLVLMYLCPDTITQRVCWRMRQAKQSWIGSIVPAEASDIWELNPNHQSHLANIQLTTGTWESLAKPTSHQYQYTANPKTHEKNQSVAISMHCVLGWFVTKQM